MERLLNKQHYTGDSKAPTNMDDNMAPKQGIRHQESSDLHDRPCSTCGLNGRIDNVEKMLVQVQKGVDRIELKAETFHRAILGDKELQSEGLLERTSKLEIRATNLETEKTKINTASGVIKLVFASSLVSGLLVFVINWLTKH